MTLTTGMSMLGKMSTGVRWIAAADDQQQQGENDEGVRPAQGQLDDPHGERGRVAGRPMLPGRRGPGFLLLASNAATEPLRSASRR
jgi:hypothetical protein